MRANVLRGGGRRRKSQPVGAGGDDSLLMLHKTLAFQDNERVRCILNPVKRNATDYQKQWNNARRRRRRRRRARGQPTAAAEEEEGGSLTCSYRSRSGGVKATRLVGNDWGNATVLITLLTLDG